MTKFGCGELGLLYMYTYIVSSVTSTALPIISLLGIELMDI